MKGKIEKQYPTEFEVIKAAAFKVWDGFKGTYSDAQYNTMGLSRRRFLMDSFHGGKVKIGDGVGTHGDIIIPNCLDDYIHTAMGACWKQYIESRPANFAGN